MTSEPQLRTDWARDPEAFAAVYRENAPRLRVFLRQIVASPQAAEDLTQEIFTQLWSQPNGFDPARGSLRAYLFGIARHKAAEWWRRHKPEDTLLDDRCAACNPERASVMGDALHRLPKEQRLLLWLREVEGQTYAELAVILDVPVGTVRSRLFMPVRHCGRSGWAQPDKESCMRCDEAQEFVSAMYDGETVPQEAAQHMARCAACGELLQSYAEMGVALRSYSSLQLAEPVPERTWLTRKQDAPTWFEKGWQMMRIPRIAFASLVLLLVVLGSRLALVEVRAHEDGSVLLLKLTLPSGEATTCPLSTTDPKLQVCSGMTKADNGWFTYGVRFLRKKGDRVLLGVVTDSGSRTSTYSPDEVKALAKTELWFSPGQTVQLPGTGNQKIITQGEWTDHVPLVVAGSQSTDPGPNEIRLTAPLLLKNNKVVADVENASASADKANEGVSLYIPGQGRFIMSITPFQGATRGEVKLNRISFESNGQAYLIVTGMPVTRGETIWILHKTSDEADTDPAHWSVGAGPLSNLL